MYAITDDFKAVPFSGLAKSFHPPVDSSTLKGGWYVDEESSLEVFSVGHEAACD
jgi:hypothetical protein